MSPLEFGGVVRPENGVLVRVHEHQWLVPSQSEGTWRLTEHGTDGWRCSCPSWTEAPDSRGMRFECKHVRLVKRTLET